MIDIGNNLDDRRAVSTIARTLQLLCNKYGQDLVLAILCDLPLILEELEREREQRR